MWRFIPREATGLFVKACTDLLMQYARASETNDESAKHKALYALLLLPRRVLTKHSAKGFRRELRALKWSLRNAFADEPERENEKARDERGVGGQSKTDANVAKAIAIIGAGGRNRAGRAVRALLSSQSSVRIDASDAVWGQRISALYPPRNRSVALPALPAAAAHTVVESKRLVDIIQKRLQFGAAAGVSGWTGEMLGVLCASAMCVTGLCAIVNDILNGSVPIATADLLRTKRGIPLPKGAEGVRPVTCEEVFCKLAGLYGASCFNTASAFPAIQLGVGVSGGCERAVHSIRAATESYGDQSVLISTDIKNAYNTRSRATILEEAFKRAEASPIWRMLYWALSQTSVVMMYGANGQKTARIYAEEGVAQGDVLAPWAYANSMQKVYTAAAGVVAPGRAHTTAYLDDFNIVGTSTDALTVFRRFRDECEREGVALSVEKCRVLWPHPTNPPDTIVEQCARLGLVLVRGHMEVLGAWVGCDSPDVSVSSRIVTAADSHKVLFDALAHKQMPAQLGSLLLRQCAQPRMGYLARVTPPAVSVDGLKRFDSMVVECFREINALPEISGASVAYHLLSMPIRSGGFGLRSYSLIAHSAYFASAVNAICCFDESFVAARCASSVPQAPPCTIDHLNAAFSHVLQTGLQNNEYFPQTKDEFWREYKDANRVPPHLQQSLVAVQELVRMDERKTWNDADRAAVMSAKQANASRWMTVVPDRSEYRLTNPEFRVAVCLRLRLPAHPSLPIPTCACLEAVRVGSDHLFVCPAVRKTCLFCAS